jgi:hypothetical protein
MVFASWDDPNTDDHGRKYPAAFQTFAVCELEAMA